MKLNAIDAEKLSAAVQALKDGEVIGLPTETVYGLAADAMNTHAVKKIFALKGRPIDHPLIVHIADASQLSRWANNIPEEVFVLAQHFWPGPLTMILKKQPQVPDVVTGGQDTVGLRCPAHPLALALLQQFGSGVAAPSANRFGRISPTTAQHVRDEFGDAVPVILEGGECEVGIESTIIDLSNPMPRILRPGMISQTEIESVIGVIGQAALDKDQNIPRASGTLAAHYAPRTPMKSQTRAEILRKPEPNTCYLLLDEPILSLQSICLANNSQAYAHHLYAALRELDQRNCSLIIIEQTPQNSEWLAVNDRLSRALAGAGAGLDDAL
jgi:L-threonylcarbamoyladenylate synthase